jgi:hypothetical protein
MTLNAADELRMVDYFPLSAWLKSQIRDMEAVLEPRTRAAVVEEVTWALLEQFDFGERVVNNLHKLRELAREFDVPYMVLRVVIDSQMVDEAREILPQEALEYVRWCEQNAPERLAVANG